MKNAAEFLREGAKTFDERNAIYGNNYLNVGKALEALFPEGLALKTADDWNRIHIFMLGIVKQSRYANNFCKGGHPDSSHDNTVYSAMLESIDADIAERAAEKQAAIEKAFRSPPPASPADALRPADRHATPSELYAKALASGMPK